jgi:hypothetical protein
MWNEETSVDSTFHRTKDTGASGSSKSKKLIQSLHTRTGQDINSHSIQIKNDTNKTKQNELARVPSQTNIEEDLERRALLSLTLLDAVVGSVGLHDTLVGLVETNLGEHTTS